MADNRNITSKPSLITGAIFDCDGTLLDSLDTWRGLEGMLAKMVNVTVTPEERKLFTTFTIPEVAHYFHEHYGLGKSDEQVIGIIDDYMMDYYGGKAKALPGVLPFLEVCASAGVKMCVASSSSQRYLRAGLAHAGIAEYFTDVFSVDDVGAPKREPVIFNVALAALGTNRASTWGIDDSLYALETLQKAQFPAIGVYNEAGGVARDAVEEVSDVAVARLDELAVSNGILESLN